MGFVGNRMMFPYMREAQFLIEEGATPAQVDRALNDFGMAMGIFAVDDMGGIDLNWRVQQEYAHLVKPGIRQPLMLRKLFELGRYGQKTGRGWYLYDENRKATPDPEVEALIEQTAKEAGIERRAITDEEIIERCIYVMINEGARILEEGHAVARFRYRCHLFFRLRISGLSRRPDVVRRYRRPEKGVRQNRRVPSRSTVNFGSRRLCSNASRRKGKPSPVWMKHP